LSKQLSFSLIELLIVIALITLLFSITLPSTNYFLDHLMTSETDRLCTTIIFLRQKALASNTPQTVYLNQATHSYSYKSGEKTIEHHFPNGIMFGFLPRTQGPPANPHRLLTRAITFPKQQITCWPSGIISSGTTYITDRKKKYMKAFTCAISQVSFIRKYYYQNGKWIRR